MGFFLFSMMSLGCLNAGAVEPEKPYLAAEYLSLAAHYAVYSPEIWHEDAAGGYWGGGAGSKDMNGSIRATNSIMLAYAQLVHAWDRGWLTEEEIARLTEAGLGRAELVRHAVDNLRYITAHHKAAPEPLEPLWGHHWQSSLWIGTSTVAGFLIWEELPKELRESAAHMAAVEADRIAAAPPRPYRVGNTGAEENGWDTHALAAALALNPGHAARDTWWRALRAYAVNTYSRESDRQSDATLGEDRLADIVTTANIFEDYTMENHNFLHPDYIQVSGQELGEAWLILSLGDEIAGTDWAPRFEPYALHNTRPVWEEVMRRLLLPNGEFFYPNGSDWTLNTSVQQAYLAWIATTLDEPVAALAAKRQLRSAQRRREVSPPNRILGDTNLKWWWEPLLLKRNAMAMLIYEQRGAPDVTPAADEYLSRGTWTTLFPDGKAWVHRNPNYMVSASWGRVHTGVFHPIEEDSAEMIWMTSPTFSGVLPDSVRSLNEAGENAVVLGLKDGRQAALVCLPDTVLWLSPEPFRPLGIENHAMTGAGRDIHTREGKFRAPALEKIDPIETTGSWINIDNRFGMIAPEGFHYTAAGGFNRRSGAVDSVAPSGNGGAWLMVPGADTATTARLAKGFEVSSADDVITAHVDSPSGTWNVTLNLRAAESDGTDSPSLHVEKED